MLEVRGLYVRYGEFVALRDLSLRVCEGEIVALLGANGAGKSTLFRALSGLIAPAAGEILWDGRELGGAPAHAIVRAGIAQSPEGKHLFRELSVEKNLRLGAYVHRRDRDGIRRSLDQVYALFPALHAKRGDPAGSLSGGQQQMVSIGRALMARPRLLLLDEPTLGLAPLVADEVLHAAAEISRQGTLVLLAEQNAYAALEIAHRGYVIEQGEIVLEGAGAELREDPEVRRAYMGM